MGAGASRAGSAAARRLPKAGAAGGAKLAPPQRPPPELGPASAERDESFDSVLQGLTRTVQDRKGEGTVGVSEERALPAAARGARAGLTAAGLEEVLLEVAEGRGGGDAGLKKLAEEHGVDLEALRAAVQFLEPLVLTESVEGGDSVGAYRPVQGPPS